MKSCKGNISAGRTRFARSAAGTRLAASTAHTPFATNSGHTPFARKAGTFALSACLAVLLAACAGCSSTSASSSASASTSASASVSSQTTSSVPTKDSLTITQTIENSADGEHAITADGQEASYANTAVTKTGDSDSGDEADFYGDNAAIFATNGATLDLNEMLVETAGKHANGVFSYGEGTTVNISNSVIETTGDCSGGLMTTGGGTMNATNLSISTSGNSSAAIRSDRGGGTVTVNGGAYKTTGTGSPVIYSTADITVSNATLESTASQGVVVEGKNSVALNNVDLTADNNTKNSDKSSYYQAVMIYQSMSGDAATGKASFAMDGGSITNANGDVFFVNNTVAEINLTGANIVNNGNGAFLRAEAAGWGSDGSNGGQVTLNASAQTINGNMVVDSVSNLNLYLGDASMFTGAINSDGEAGDVYVELSGGSKWVLTADSYITSLTCDASSIDLNGHTLYVNGVAYTSGTSSTGSAIEVVATSGSGNGGGGMGGGMGGDKPDGEAPDGEGGGAGGAGGDKPDSKPDAAPGGEGGGKQ